MAFNFSNKKILITGAGRGIGRALAMAIHKSGGTVYAVSKQQTTLNELVKECGGTNIHPIQVDLMDWDKTRDKLVILEAMDGLVNNAGISYPPEPSLDALKKNIEDTFNVNMMAAINVTQVVGRKMAEAGKGGSIVNVSSVNGINPMSGSLAYNMSKAALDMMTKQFALELGPHNIRVNSVNPTVTMTDMSMEHWSEPVRASRMKSLTPLGRFADIDEVVGPILYLMSDYSSMVTGTINPIEGGLLSNISV